MTQLFFVSLALATFVIFIHFLRYFWICERHNNYGLIDIGWGEGFVYVAWSLMIFRVFILETNASFIGWLTLVFVTLWGLRLSRYLRKRNLGKPEDYRYVSMRAKITGPYKGVKSFVKIFLVQALFMLVISLVIIINIMAPVFESIILVLSLILGSMLWMFGYFLQVKGDQQLATFKANPANKGKLLRTGLWAYTRHPNYAGEALMWIGLGVFMFATGFPIAIIIIGLLSPLTISLLVRYVSGVPLLEKKMMQHPDFKDYAFTTSVFWPWFPRKPLTKRVNDVKDN
jgi:steroid 5-alpha reductase family enzyme